MRLSPEGHTLYGRVLYMRPKVDYIDADVCYHFSCSRMQAEYYFEKFGADAEVLCPSSLREKLSDFYEKAHALYGPFREENRIRGGA